MKGEKKMKADERLEELGFKLKSYSEEIGSWVYENTYDDHRVEICDDGDEYVIHSQSISTYKDWMGESCPLPMGLKYNEIKAFMDKIEELKGDN